MEDFFGWGAVFDLAILFRSAVNGINNLRCRIF